ncbi:MAG TPA: SGNH/GDSL hydrolase family protein, partial [Candidatus Limnocylindria bacterium]|nr:SGNH/GDSL hydrolase family protein [Candidatus Limnocylindria bacterium]
GEADPPVSLVTLDIGGNDLLRLLTADPCASQPDGAACQGQVRGTLASFEVNLRRVLDELRAALDVHAPDAPLLVMTYFNPFSGTDAIYERGGEVALLGEDLTIDCQAAGDPAMRGMNDIILCVAGEAGAIGVDVHPRFTALGLELTHIGAQDIHANDRGYEVIAAEMLAELDRHTSPASAGRSAIRSALHLQ